jgi:hypothetical protein
VYRIFEDLLEYLDCDSLEELKQQRSGYVYKLSQEFLLSSSTFEKEKKIEEIIDYLDQA